MNKPARISYVIMAVLLFLIAWLHLGTLALTTLFGYFVLRRLNFRHKKWIAVLIYVVAVLAIGWGLFYFSRQMIKKLPEIAENTIPAVVDFAETHKIALPFDNYATAKTAGIEYVKDSVANIGRYAGVVAFLMAQLVIGLVVAVGMFLDSRWGTDVETQTTRNSIYSAVVGELSIRFRIFFASFSKVIGAQIIISLINTALTAIFLAANHYPYHSVIVVLTFLCGLLPIIGNILSNTLIVGVGFTISPKMALIAFIFLVVVHKLEYFLNSKIIGDRIKNPMWLTLIGLVLGEKLMGIPGMIIAPVVLHYIKVEASHAKMTDLSQSPDVPTQTT